MKKNEELTGEWYLPGKNHRAQGRIIVDYDRKKIELEIFGDKSIDGLPYNGNIMYNPARIHTYIYGKVAFGENIILYDCSLKSVKSIGKAFVQITYTIEFIFRGGTIPNDTETIVEAGTFRFPFIDSWYNGPDSVELSGDLNNFLMQNPDTKIEFDKERNVQQVKIYDDFTLRFFEVIKKYYRQINVHYELIREYFVEFTYSTAVSFGRLMRDASSFCSLLEFCSGEPQSFKLVQLVQPGEGSSPFTYSEAETPNAFTVCNFSLQKGGKEIENFRHSNMLLLSRWTLPKIHLNRIIIEWMKFKDFHHIYDYYNDTNEWFADTDAMLSEVMFNNRFLNIIQGIEDYYRKSIDPVNEKIATFESNKQQIMHLIKDRNLKHWLNNNFKAPQFLTLEQKLQGILNEFPIEISILFGQHNITIIFPKKATEFRNSLSHGKGRISDTKGLQLTYFYGKILLTMCLLKKLGVSDIAKRIHQFMPLHKDVEWIKSVEIIKNNDDQTKFLSA